MRLPVQVQCIIFRRKENDVEFLVLKRIESRGGFWQSVTGGYEEEDTSLKDVCYREIEEETGISKDDVISEFDHVHRFQFEEEGFFYTEYVFGFEVSSEAKVSINRNVYPEHSEYRWADLEQALELYKHQSSKESLHKLKEKI